MRQFKVILSIILLVYLTVALCVAMNEPDGDTCKGVKIEVLNTDEIPDPAQFVTAEELAHELGDLPDHAKGMPMSAIDTQALRLRLLKLDKIEDAEVVRYSDGTIRISAHPMVPVARIFDRDKSYYVNRAGKRITASARYHKSVPVIRGHFDEGDTTFTPLNLLPLINYIAADTTWNSFISMIDVKSPRDIILVPMIREHVINLGAPTDFEDKLARLKRFYAEVLPHQGWEKYDTLSLKWKGQLVASKRVHEAPKLPSIREEDEEAVDVGSMLAAEGVAPGQTRIGAKPTLHTPIPAKGKLSGAPAPAKEEKEREPEKERDKETKDKAKDSKTSDSKKTDSKKSDSGKSDSKKSDSKKTAEAKKSTTKKG